MLRESLKAAAAAAVIHAPPMPPAFVYFDLGNVIATFDRERAFRQMAALTGVEIPVVRQATIGGLQADLESGQIDWPDFHQEFSRLTASESDPAQLAAAAADMFELNVEILPVIAALEQARVPIGILSNTCDIHWQHLLSRGWGVLPGGFRQIVLSHEARASKPDPAIFALAATRAGVAAETIFFCDDLPEHVAAARAAGWDAELYQSAVALADQLDRRGLTLGL
jgi:glucose-1-phosphatase